MAIDGYHINGPCIVSAGVGTSDALVTVGYSQDGVDIDIGFERDPIHTDISGPRVPADFQDMGEQATIRIAFIASDRANLAKMLNRGDRSAAGQRNTPGSLVGAGGAAFALALTGSDAPWYFLTCLVVPNASSKLGTQARPFVLTLRAWPYIAYTSTSGKDAVLYARSLPGS